MRMRPKITLTIGLNDARPFTVFVDEIIFFNELNSKPSKKDAENVHYGESAPKRDKYCIVQTKAFGHSSAKFVHEDHATIIRLIDEAERKCGRHLVQYWPGPTSEELRKPTVVWPDE